MNDYFQDYHEYLDMKYDTNINYDELIYPETRHNMDQEYEKYWR